MTTEKPPQPVHPVPDASGFLYPRQPCRSLPLKRGIHPGAVVPLVSFVLFASFGPCAASGTIATAAANMAAASLNLVVMCDRLYR